VSPGTSIPSSVAVLFPGQGSQSVGMGADVFASRPDLLGDRADAVLGWSLGAVVSEGPEDKLTRTDRAQPALYAVSFALWEALSAVLPSPPVAAAGHSLGEYTALAAAGVFDFDTGLSLVAARGKAMAHAARRAASSMAALLGADLEGAERIAAERRASGGRLWIANVNAPGQIVLAGGKDDVAWLIDNARDLGARRAIELKVAGAFHTPYMAPAADELVDALSTMTFHDPRFPVYANATAEPMEDPRIELAEQLVAPVRFASTLRNMADHGVGTFIHVGPGDVTAGLARRTVPDAEVLVVSSLEDIAAVADHPSVQ
jgi:[acyl-carrier-protein] S-malonyltransferase